MVNWHGPLPSFEWAGDAVYSNESTIVSVPGVELPCVSDEVYQQLFQQFSSFSESQSFGLDIYIQVVTFLASLCID